MLELMLLLGQRNYTIIENERNQSHVQDPDRSRQSDQGSGQSDRWR